MESTASISRYLTTELLVWRNPAGREENWVQGDEKTYNRSSDGLTCKNISTEIALYLLIPLSLIEIIVYTSFQILSLVFSCLSPNLRKASHFFGARAENAIGALVIDVAATVMNIRHKNVPIRLNSYLKGLPQLPAPNRYGPGGSTLPAAPYKSDDELVQEATFLLNYEILSNLTKEEREEFLFEVRTLNFIVARALFLYIFTTQATAPIPRFFADKTQEDIHAFRNSLKLEKPIYPKSKDAIDELSKYFESLDSFDPLPQPGVPERTIPETINKVFNLLNGLASEEMQRNGHGFLFTALQKISQGNPAQQT